MRICFLSNGFGEDRSAAIVASRLMAEHPGIQVVGASLLSDGAEYRERGVGVLATGWMPASGGFSTASMRAFVRDLPIVPHLTRFRRQLAAHDHEIDAVVVVGDVFLLLLAHAALTPKPVFIALAKSNYHQPHSAVERALLRAIPRVTITRDEATRAALEARDIRARWFGNLLMDGFGPAALARPSATSVVLLPGSRVEAPANLLMMLDVVRQVDIAARWVCALAPSVSTTAVAEACLTEGWKLDDGQLVHRERVVHLVRGAFERTVAEADVALGMAGTANEQAAGLGCPVVCFPGAGLQASATRLRRQAQLLGGGAIFVSGGASAAAAEVSRLLRDPAERAMRGRTGKARMGPPASAGVVRFLTEELGLQPRSGPRLEVEAGDPQTDRESAPLISVQICTRNRCEQLARCLTSLFSVRFAPENFEIVLVDDGSTDETERMVNALSPPCTLRRIRQPHAGLARARNAGILAARGEIVLFLDDDVIAAPALLQEHYRSHQRDGGRSVVVGTVRHIETSDVPSRVRPRVANWSTSFFWTCNASARRVDLVAAGLFDEAFTEYGWEDLELGDRLRRLGLRRRRSRAAIVYHVKPRWRGGDLPQLIARAEASGRSAVIYTHKSGSWRARLATGLSPVRVRANLWAARWESVWWWLAQRAGNGELRGVAQSAAWLLQRAHYYRAAVGAKSSPVTAQSSASRTR